MSIGKAIFYVATLLIIIFFATWIIETSTPETWTELKQEAQAAYDWTSCKIHGGTPTQASTQENYYHLECKK